jgi:hypothetical protein
MAAGCFDRYQRAPHYSLFSPPHTHTHTYTHAQDGYSEKERPMIDLVFAVDDAEAWHRENIKQNPNHYSFLRCVPDLFGTRGRSMLT